MKNAKPIKFKFDFFLKLNIVIKFRLRKLRYGFFRGLDCQLLGNISIDKSSMLGDNVTITTSRSGKVSIDSHSSIGKRAWIAAGDGEIIIGKNALFGPNVIIVAQNHGAQIYTGQAPWLRDGRSSTVRIGNQVHLGGNVVVLPGANIGDGCVVGANSIVSTNIPSGSLVVGKDRILCENGKFPISHVNISTQTPYLHLSRLFTK